MLLTFICLLYMTANKPTISVWANKQYIKKLYYKINIKQVKKYNMLFIKDYLYMYL